MANQADGINLSQRHGKSRVRVARVWRNPRDGIHQVSEWNINVSLLSHCLNAYILDDNSDIVATDSIKNTVYVKAKECSEQLSAEEFAILLGKHFTSVYPQVYSAIVKIVEKPWERVDTDGKPHTHGFKLGSEKHTVEAIILKGGSLKLSSGIQGLSVLKTTQSGFEGFVRDQYTILPETRERMLATEITASWRYSYEHVSSIPQTPLYFYQKYLEVKKVFADTFFGCPKTGVYSPSVQRTLYLMGNAVLKRFLDVSSVHLSMPNIHFLPVNLSSKENPTMVKFNNDVFLPTDEPHGSIEATLTRTSSKL